jgi:malate synthase
VQGVQINGTRDGRFDDILTADALEFVARLHREFDRHPPRAAGRPHERQKELDAGGTLDFLPDTKAVRESAAGEHRAPRALDAGHRVRSSALLAQARALPARRGCSIRRGAELCSAPCPVPLA